MPTIRTERTAAKPGVNPWLIAITVSMATFMEVLDTSIANVSLGHIAGSLGAGLNESTWVLTSYLVSNAIIIPISGWLSTVMGRKAFYMTCVALFTVSSFFCGIAPSLGVLLLCRVLQGVGGGGLAPSEQAILADTFPPEQLGMAFSIWAVAVIVAPALGPTLGGWITDNFSWRWIFFINVPVGLLSMFLTYNLVQDSPVTKAATQKARHGGIRVDYMGFAFTVLGFGALQVVLDKGQEDDWFGSPFICGFAALAIIGVVGLVVWEMLIVKNPIVDLPLMFANRPLAMSMLLQFIVGFVLNATTQQIPQFVQQLLGYDAMHAGMVLMPGGLVLMFLMPVGGMLERRFQPKYLMAIGLAFTAYSMFYLCSFNTQVTFWQIAMARVLMCLGLPLFFIPLTTIAYGNLPPGKNNSASAMMNLMRNLGGGFGIAAVSTMLVRRSQMHQERLSTNATRFYQPFVHFMENTGGFTQKNIVGFYGTLERQATMLSYLDVFKTMAIGCLIAMGLVLLMRRVNRKAANVAVH
jgi:MFS transporter, DHA2 family, multidrug resistance protein